MDQYVEKICIGRGNYGSAHLAHEKGKPETKLVIKKIPIELLSEKEKEQAHGECDVLAHLHHPHIVEYHTSFLENDVLHIIMSYCPGGDLNQQIKLRDRDEERTTGTKYFSQMQILDWFVQMAMAVRYLHRLRILHRDIKSSNIFLTEHQTIKLGDFGIARVLDSTLDQAKTVVGTPYYMSMDHHICG